MYDRIMSLGRYPNRPVTTGGPIEPLAKHVHGDPVIRNPMNKFKADPPLEEVEN